MAIIRLINTTTPLRVDDALESAFFRIIDPAFKTAIEKQCRDRYLDVQLVGRGIRNLARHDTSQREEIPDTDVLGVYVSHNLPSHYLTIKVCPERILDACQRWNKKIGGALAFADRYPALLHGVIIHELAHFLMDDHLISDRCRPNLSWSKFIGGPSVDSAREPSDWVNQPVSDDRCEKVLQQKLTFAERHCTWREASHKGLIGKYPVVMRQLKKHRKIIEESLANAFMLKQKFGKGRLAALSTFVESQSKTYQAGLRWTGDIAQTLQTASSWRRFKVDDIGFDGRKWVAARADRREILTGLAQRLKNRREAIVSFDFQKGA